MDFLSYFPQQEPLPVIISLSHSGNIFPQISKASMREADACSTTDILLNASSYGVSVFRPRFNYHWVDLCGDPSASQERDAISCGPALPIGSTLEKKFNSDLSKSVQKNRLGKYFWPYYKSIEDRVLELQKENMKVLILDIHCFDRPVKSEEILLFPGAGLRGNKNLNDSIASFISSNKIRVGNSKIKCSPHLVKYFDKNQENVYALQMSLSKKLLADDNHVNQFYENKIQRLFREFSFWIAGMLKDDFGS